MIRDYLPADAAAVASLATQLGYPSTALQISERFASIQGRVLLFVLEERVVGFIHFLARSSMIGEPRVEIASLVIDSSVRGQGIGTKLVAAAEEWGRGQGFKKARLLSRTTRPDAHRLYLRLGYSITKTSHVFDKKL
jgi:GNAT superfamily N-acetyltransferase